MTDQTIYLKFNDSKSNNKGEHSTKSKENIVKGEILKIISDIIDENKWNQTLAAKKLNVDQPKISQIKNNKASGFSLERLLTFLTRLNCKIDLVITKNPVEQ